MAGGEAGAIIEATVAGPGGVELLVRSRGDGVSTVFLHGSMANGGQSLWLLGGLADTCHLIAPDIRGRGSSVCPNVDQYSWTHFATDVAAVLDGFGIESAIVGGTSLGAGIAASFAMMFPERTLGLILMGSPFRGAELGWSPFQQHAYESSAHAAERVRALGLAEAVKELGAGLPPEVVEATRQRWAQHDALSISTALIAEARLPQPFSLTDLQTIDAPVLVLPGGDNMHPREVSKSYMPYLQRGTLRDVPIPPQPADIVAATRDWISESMRD